ncbi:phosphoadenosine phosphosulfate reductase domain-containing protein [Hymenobacter siberiensis]|uniref:phosphoadenosine phosphosulfate reductase domain-containing protein n=1 Tax=Hymenobacter siberiensis TaxID=2848396 RepID=UPI001C1E0B32|nr:phosphoadenosine phosphosulfate reductase family protein [Hymenobacter siberiensis]
MKTANQFDLFARPAASLAVPPAVEQALQQGAALCISISGGKDSQALLAELAPWFRQRGYGGQLFAIHADLGRAEWGETPAFVELLCQRASVPLIVVQRTKGDLVQRIQERMDTVAGTDTPFWPSAASRYCTSHLKGNPIDTALRDPLHFWPSSSQRYCTSDLKRGPIDSALRDFEVIISAEGVRADESKARAKKPAVEIRTSITAQALRDLDCEDALAQRKPGQRVAFNWRPLLNYNTEEVWQACGATSRELAFRQQLYAEGHHADALAGWVGHPAYVYGNERLSCALCVLGSKKDLINGANHNPETYGLYLELEVIGNSTFKHKESLFDLPVTGRAAEVKAEWLARKNEPVLHGTH